MGAASPPQSRIGNVLVRKIDIIAMSIGIAYQYEKQVIRASKNANIRLRTRPMLTGSKKCLSLITACL